MITNQRLDEIQSHLNNIENHLTTLPAQKEQAKQDIMNELKRVEIRIAWYALMIAGFGLIGAGFVGAGYYWWRWPAFLVGFLVGVAVFIIGCCGIRCRWFIPRSK